MATKAFIVLILTAASKCVLCEVRIKINEMCSDSCEDTSQPCPNFGPCIYGIFTEIVGNGGDSWCKAPWPGKP